MVGFDYRFVPFSMISGGRSTPSTPSRSITSVARQVDNRASAIATATWTSITGGETIVGIIRFNGADVRGITGQDFDVLDNNNNPQSRIIGVSSTSADDGESVTVTGAPPSRIDGLFKLRLRARRVRSDRSATGNAPTSDVISNPVTVDNIIVIAQASWTNVLGGNNLIGFLQFTDAGVEGVEASDFEILNSQNVTQNNWSVNVSKEDVIAGDTTIITATPPNNTYGAFRIKFNSLSVMSDGDNEDNAPLSPTYSNFSVVDTRPVIVAGARWTSIAGGTTLVGKIAFSDAIVLGITSGAFRVQNSIGVDQTDWTISVSNSFAAPNILVTVTATPNGTKSGAFRLKINARFCKEWWISNI